MPQGEKGDAPSRSARKRAAQAVEDLARQLAELSEPEVRKLPAGTEIVSELLQIRGIRSLAARDRQIRHLAGVLRQRDEELTALLAFVAGHDRRQHEERVRFHRLEEWRDRLCDPQDCPQALAEVLQMLPQVDADLLARLARAAHGGDRRAFREIFRHLRRASEEAT